MFSIDSVSAFVVGGVLALVSLFTLVNSATGAPESNPADQPVIVYGSNS